MKEIIRFWMVKRMIKDSILSAEIYQMLYHKKTFVSSAINPTQVVYGPIEAPLKKVIPQLSERKKQLMDSLKVLMDKKIKTKQDKESIEILRAVLQNEK
jgi:hypothetical protein